MPTSLIAPAVGAAVTWGANKLFGGKKGEAQAPLQNFTPSGFSGGGLNTSFAGGNLTLAPTAERTALVSSLGRGFGLQANELAALREGVAPGMSDLRTSRLQQIENAKNAAIGDLRENLQRRRVLGSSFGQDALTRAQAEFGQQSDRVAAESFLQELEMTNNLINQQFQASRQQFQTGLDELNLQADLAAKLSSGATKTMGDNAQFLAALNAKEAAASGKFFGETFGPLAKGAGEGASKLFKDFNFGGGGALPGSANLTPGSQALLSSMFA